MTEQARSKNTRKFYIYIAKCSDGSLYTGYTNNLENRKKRHNLGLGARYTRTRLPIKVIYFEIFSSRKQAMRREREIKSWRKSKKLTLVNFSRK